MNFLDNFSINYATKFRSAFSEVQLITKHLIETHWDGPFDKWLDWNGHNIFKNLYVICFRSEFEHWMDKHKIALLEKASKSLLYAIRTHRRVYPSASCEELVKYMKTYIEIHMEDFDVWCDRIRTSFECDERVSEELVARARGFS